MGVVKTSGVFVHKEQKGAVQAMPTTQAPHTLLQVD